MPEFDNTQAEAEGWSIFECSGGDNGPWQLQKCDDKNVFVGDGGAWKFVCEKIREGSAYHILALLFLETHNPTEWKSIKAFQAAVTA